MVLRVCCRGTNRALFLDRCCLLMAATAWCVETTESWGVYMQAFTRASGPTKIRSTCAPSRKSLYHTPINPNPPPPYANNPPFPSPHYPNSAVTINIVIRSAYYRLFVVEDRTCERPKERHLTSVPVSRNPRARRTIHTCPEYPHPGTRVCSGTQSTPNPPQAACSSKTPRTRTRDGGPA